MKTGKNNTRKIALIGGILVLIILVSGTVWMGHNARKDTENAARMVSLLYLDELAGRREQVVENNLQNKIKDLQTAVNLMEAHDLSSKDQMEEYQARMKQLYTLEKFAFVDTEGLIYTSEGYQDNIADYSFDYKTIREPEISILNLRNQSKKVVIAIPIQKQFVGNELTVCFMEIDMERMLEGASIDSSSQNTTFCNIYTRDGVALSNTVLGGLAVEDNLLTAMEKAEFEKGYSYEKFQEEFRRNVKGVVSFNYGGIHETLSYVPVKGTDWMLTYLIRESLISDKIRSLSEGIILRSVMQSLLTIAALLILFAYIISENRKNAKLRLQHETAEAENRARQEEMEHRLAIQEQLLEEERRRTRQDSMITALSSDYWSVYYVDLDSDTGICYQPHADMDDGLRSGEEFHYLDAFTAYAHTYVTDEYRDNFLQFIQPRAIREGLKENRVISYTYMVSRHGKELYETVRFAGVRHPEDREDHLVHSVGACFVNADAQTRKSMEYNQALSDALKEAEQANKAKTAFLSSMSHEIRTPMNAIIGLDNIALNDPEVPEKTKGYLEKIGASAEHLLSLINDILDMSRIESGRMTLRVEEFSFAKMLEAINTIFSGQCQDKGLDYQCHIKGEIDNYYIGDSMKLRQVLINILGNAVKFTPAGGKVSLQVERMAEFEGKTTIRFTAADTGIGMSKEFLPHIFDTFAQEDSSATSQYGSSGLGLAITKNIVEMMNGSIEVESEKGKGSTFYITVTLADSARSSAQQDSDEINLDEMTVLIIDDDPVARSHAKLVLEKAGISSEMAESGAKAVEMVRLRHARRAPYNLILVDWQMPDMDGVETTRQMREVIGQETAIIILTAYRWDDILEEALKAGVDSFIPKPLFAENVLEEFKSAVRRRRLTEHPQEHKAELTGRRILLAEDMQVNAEIMEMLLGMRGMETDVAENGRIAVDKYVRHEPGYYDAVLMDMRMPEMDGLEATRTIRAMGREDSRTIPIIALTANAFDEDVQRSLQAGLNAHLSKPVNPDNLFETLESLIPD